MTYLKQFFCIRYKMKYFLYCIIIFNTILKTDLVAQERSKEAIENSFTNKNLSEIKEELIEFKSKLQEMQTLSSLRISGGPATGVETKHISNFSIIKGDSVFNNFEDSKKDIRLYQEIINDTSVISFRFPYELKYYPKPYENIELSDTKFMINKLCFFDGKEQDVNSKEAYFFTHNLRKVDSALVTFEYQYVKNYNKVSLSNKNWKSKDDKIKLSFIKKNEVEIEIDSLVSNTILYIEAVDASGKALWKKSNFKSQSTIKPQEEYLKEMSLFISTVIQKIESKKIASKKDLAAYMYTNQPHEKIIENKTPVVTYFNTYAGEIEKVHIYFSPIIANKKKTFYITNSSEYINGVEIAIKNDKYGFVNKDGNWVVPPNYPRITKSIIDNYYNVTIGDKRKLHFLDKEKKTLFPVPYYVMSKKIYNDQYLEICANPYHNMEKGLVDLKTSKIILTPAKRGIDANANFYASNVYIDGHTHFYEIFRFSDHKKIIKGNFQQVILDGDLILVSYLKKILEKPKGIGYTTTFHEGKKEYYYRYFDIYDKNGIKTNKLPYSNFPDNHSFGKDNLLLVDKKIDRAKKDHNYLFINRKGQEENIDLTPYRDVKSFSNGLAIVKDKATGKYGFINTKGTLVIPMLYKEANHFIGGSSMVSYVDDKGLGKTVLINEENKIIFIFPDNVYSYSAKHDAKEGEYYTYKKGKYNHKGEKINSKK